MLHGYCNKTLTIVVLAVFYLVAAFVSLRQSSQPANPCVANDQSRRPPGCLRPLMSANDHLSLELWILQPLVVAEHKEDNNDKRPQRYQWTLVETCREGLTFSVSDARTVLGDARSSANCTLELPEFSRQRRSINDKNRHQVQPLKAKFVLRKHLPDKNSSVSMPVVAEAPLELTRLVERRVGGSGSSSSLWSSISSSDANQEKQRRNLLGAWSAASSNETTQQEKTDVNQTLATKVTAALNETCLSDGRVDGAECDASETAPPTGKTESTTMLVPHLKYHAEPILLRYVADEQEYGFPPYRGDGIPMPIHRLSNNLYRPLVYVDDTALRHASQREMAESGEGRPRVTLRIRVSVISPLRDVIHGQVKLGMDLLADSSVLHETELDEIRYLINDDHVYRFALTQVISWVHLWLDYVAFLDEVGFYVGRTDLGGLSVSSIVTRFACSLIIFLYLFEGGGTSALVLVSVGSNVAADLFKVWKVLKPGWSPSFPFLTIRDASRLSRTEQETTHYDHVAHLYLGLLLYPCVMGLALYGLWHYEYTSWWSWLISNLANAVYTFGFIALCPQLYINYRLKSVAHMPWKVFLYKLFTTFVDDVFAFLIEMPLKHKLMTLRDDVVFVIFLVQAYVYRVDKTRPNEFGFAYEQEQPNQEAVASEDWKKGGKDKQE